MMPTGLQTTGPDQTADQTGPRHADRTDGNPTGPDRQSGTQTAEQTGKKPDRTNAWALGLALAAVAAVWIGGCVWSFEEQKAFAAAKGFQVDWILPAVVDGMALALAAVAFAAALDGRPAIGARIGTALAVAASATSNAVWAWERTGGGSEAGGDFTAVALAAGVPIAANLAFEVLLSEFRQQVLRRRGVPAPVKVPAPRPVRLLLSPIKSSKEWRRMVLDATDPAAAFEGAKKAAKADPGRTKRTRTGPQTAAAEPDQSGRATNQTASVQTAAAITGPVADQTKPSAPDRDAQPDQTEAPVALDAVRTKRTNDDTAALAQLHDEYGNQTPTVDQVQSVVGGGRSRAVRLRKLFVSGLEQAS
jgi:hypothetical protein